MRGEALAGKSHDYTLEDFGLSEAAIRRAFGPYIERFHARPGALRA